MLKKLILNNWKSFREAELEINALTILIGTNASGKSNALDALAFLNRTVQGIDLQSALAGDNKIAGIRGGVEWAALKPNHQFTLKILVGTDDERTDYLYSITVETTPRVQLVSESLDRIKKRPTTDKNPYQIHLFWTDTVLQENPSITARLYNKKKGKPQEMHRSMSILSQLEITKTITQEITEGIEVVSQVLSRLFILEPLPSLMRDYSPLTENLYSDASNIAGVLAALKADKKAEIEEAISSYVTQLPEKDVRKVWAETVGKFNTDAMLYCEEFWVSDHDPTIVDARGMSDGTLRFLAILTALLTRPKGSQIVIEEVDNGLHPSRSGLLLKMLLDISEQRTIDVLVTTHNPAILDELPLELVPDVVVAHRDLSTGDSQLTLLEDLKNLPKLMASGSLGKVTSQGLIEQSFKIN
ncbi:AAA family ATPase [Crocosphaera sp. XPORK-15E]|uniref:AAA family ATPase n=1 Tax=Crocosphaera sp. XPORK-15E TaxID=3110247 RepID=UPI002B1F8CC4|nr:AAA family ATPase [Crocosphaera sp. XPORK-15E]MEA5535996.1 AAA family ATPase [Crocosphaera sp. XPORK-15E]